MKISRGLLLAKLSEASVGLSTNEVLEQSNCFVFKAGTLYTFNDDVMVRVPSPLDFDAVVNASKLMGILGSWPDDEIVVAFRDGQFRLKGEGKKRRSGINCATEVGLPIDEVPRPAVWAKLSASTNAAMQQAARTCGNDRAQFASTCVHVTPDRVEGCDNDRFLRIVGPTGFPAEVLIPAKTVSQLEKLELAKVGIGKGWVHFKTAGGAEVSARCSHEPYHKGVDAILVLDKPEKVVLPAEVKDIVARASVFHSAAYNDKVTVTLGGNRMLLSSRSDDGWHEEEHPMGYTGREISFRIQPKFLTEVLARTRDVLVDERKMKIDHKGVQFAVSLSAKPTVPQDED